MDQDALVKAALAGLFALCAQPLAAQELMEPMKSNKLERCWGAARAGQNACETKPNGGNGCVRMATTDFDPEHYRMVKEGTCLKIGGSLEWGVPGRLAREQAEQRSSR